MSVPCRRILTTASRRMADQRLIETDNFAFEFLSRLGQRESWRKEVHRPIYHVHKWWANRLGTVFRGILLGCALDEHADLSQSFYSRHAFSGLTVFDPFMGSGTTIGEAHKLGFRSLGRDINPVAVESVRVAFGPMERHAIRRGFEQLSEGVGETIRALYRSKELAGSSYAMFCTTSGSCRLSVPIATAKRTCSHLTSSRGTPALKRTPMSKFFALRVDIFFPASSVSEAWFAHHADRHFIQRKGRVTGRTVACSRCGREFAILNAIRRKTSFVSPVRKACPAKRRRKGVPASLAG